MKNLYLLLSTIGVTVSALAVNPERSTMISSMPQSDSTLPYAKSEYLRKLAPEKENEYKSIDEIAGVYEWDGYSLVPGGTPGLATITVADAEKGTVHIDFPKSAKIVITNPLTATVDVATSTFTIDNMQKLGYDDVGQLYFYIKDTNEYGYMADGVSSTPKVIGLIDGTTISFPPASIWAIGDPYDEDLGWWYITYNNSFIRESEAPENPNEGWTSLGYATFEDGWVLPGLGFDQTDPGNWYKVELQQNDENNNIYRLVDPYHGDSPAAPYNESESVGYIQFDLSDPDHVVFDIIDCGFANADLKIYRMYCYNTLTWLSMFMSKTPEEIIDSYGDNIMYTTFKDNVLTLPVRIDQYDTYVCDAYYGKQGEKDGGYSWNDASYQPANMETRITFPNSDAVEGINADDEAVEVYYNLQGMRVCNPEKGQVVISRKGNKTSKYVVK